MGLIHLIFFGGCLSHSSSPTHTHLRVLPSPCSLLTSSFVLGWTSFSKGSSLSICGIIHPGPGGPHVASDTPRGKTALSRVFSFCIGEEHGATCVEVNKSLPMAPESLLFHIHSWPSVSEGFISMNSTNFEEKTRL